MIEYKNVLTICPYCGTGCALNLQVLDMQLVGCYRRKTILLAKEGYASKAGMPTPS
jgi:anaerobic selenocysteine-containing dehydrogenase